MAKFILNCEFESVEELREFLSATPTATKALVVDKPERKPRSKTEVAAAPVEERPVVKEEKIKVVPQAGIEVLPPVTETLVQAAPPVFNLNPHVIPSFKDVAPAAPLEISINNQPPIAVTAPPPTEGLPTDLLSALGGS